MASIFEIIILTVGAFGLAAAIFGWQLTSLRVGMGILFVVYALVSFPYPKEDRHKVGLAVGCVIFLAAGLLSMFFGGWWLLPAGAVLGYGTTLLLTRRKDKALVLNRRRWEAVVRDSDTPSDVCEAIGAGLLLGDNIDAQKFLCNYDFIECGGQPSFTEFFTGTGDDSGVTPTAREMASPLKRPPAYPLLFVAAYPDVVKWLDRLAAETLKEGDETQVRAVYATMAETLGSDFSAEDMEGPNGKLITEYLTALVRAYKANAGSRFECEVERL